MNILDGLNDAQKKAVTYMNGPLLIVAGAGTGKTRTLVHRVAHLISKGILPNNILAVTFTNKAAREMRERIEELLSPYYEAQGQGENGIGFPFVKTFHALAVYILRQNAEAIGLSKYFTILDRSDTMSLIKRGMKELSIDPKMWDPKVILKIMSNQKNKGRTVDDFGGEAINEKMDIASRVWRRYNELKKASSALDFDDLIAEAYKLLRDHEPIRKHYQKKWTHIHVDEYQDTNDIQYKLIRLFISKDAKPEEMQLCAVGDSDQTIYTWRGATTRNILNFEKDFPNAKVVFLEQNYRSTKAILDAADAIIEKNVERIPKQLISNIPTLHKIKAYQGMNAYHEARYIAEQIKTLAKEGGRYNDIGILFRTNFQSRVLEEIMLENDIPYTIAGTKFFDRKEVKDVLSYLRAARLDENLADMMRVINYPKRALGPSSVNHILAGNLQNLKPKASLSYQNFLSILEDIREYSLDHTPSQTIEHVIMISGIKKEFQDNGSEGAERLLNLNELVVYASRFDVIDEDGDAGSGFEKMLEAIALLSDQDTLDDKGKKHNAIKMMTIHASKGLEFPTVFITGLEQGLFPSDMGGSEKRDTEEERRLMYVAVTRAQFRLYLTHAYTRNIFGKTSVQEPSEFLGDIPLHLIEVDESHEEPIKTMYLEW